MMDDPMPHALVITTAGTNCDRELAHAFRLAGAEATTMHLNQLMEDPARLDCFDLLGLPGGFSFGDAVAAGRIQAQLIRRALYPAFVRAIERGVPMIAPCNGFQVAAQVGLLPGPSIGEAWPGQPPSPSCALGHNASARFVDRWCAIEIPSDTKCVWTQGLEADERTMLLPVAHGEGRFVTAGDERIRTLEEHGQVAVRYAAHDNPNGSMGDIAGICDATGLVFGLMPHPERYTRWTHHPHWTRLPRELIEREQPLGLRMFRNAVAHAKQAAAV